MQQMKFKDYFFKPIEYYRFLYLLYLCGLSFFSAAWIGRYFHLLLESYNQYNLQFDFTSIFLVIFAIFEQLYIVSIALSSLILIAVCGFILPKYLPKSFWGLTKIFMYPIALTLIQWLVFGFNLENYFIYVGVVLYLSIMLPILIINVRSNPSDLPIYSQIILAYLSIVVFVGSLAYFYNQIFQQGREFFPNYLIFLLIFGVNLFESTRVLYQQIKRDY